MSQPRKHHRPALVWAAPAVLALVLTSAGCSGSDVSTMSGDRSSAGEIAPGAPPDSGAALDGFAFDASAEGGSAEEGGSTSGSTNYATGGSSKAARGELSDVARQAVISKGTVSLRADDVAKARFDVQKVVDEFGGEVSDEATTTDEDGVVNTSRMVLRIPSGEFGDALQELEQVADLESSKRTSEDVTTQVIDVEVRLKVQRASIQRIQALLARADDIGDIVAIENQLTQRQAELNSLEQQQAYLADQTSLSTIIVHLERTDASATEPTDEKGFVAGLRSGWDGLTAFATAVATTAGLLLPFTVLLMLLAALAWPLLRPAVRRLRARQPSAPPAAPTAPAPAAPTAPTTASD
ncbi:DUF4349 domain-containing protein [Nocardioides sp.]|uniref:DUF4349 domain-containing protein n=1 Tax=Nocardioides sp. TaxID=35761 RepID=UPI003561B4DB